MRHSLFVFFCICSTCPLAQGYLLEEVGVEEANRTTVEMCYPICVRCADNFIFAIDRDVSWTDRGIEMAKMAAVTAAGAGIIALTGGGAAALPALHTWLSESMAFAISDAILADVVASKLADTVIKKSAQFVTGSAIDKFISKKFPCKAVVVYTDPTWELEYDNFDAQTDGQDGVQNVAKVELSLASKYEEVLNSPEIDGMANNRWVVNPRPQKINPALGLIMASLDKEREKFDTHVARDTFKEKSDGQYWATRKFTPRARMADTAAKVNAMNPFRFTKRVVNNEFAAPSSLEEKFNSDPMWCGNSRRNGLMTTELGGGTYTFTLTDKSIHKTKRGLSYMNLPNTDYDFVGECRKKFQLMDRTHSNSLGGGVVGRRVV